MKKLFLFLTAICCCFLQTFSQEGDSTFFSSQIHKIDINFSQIGYWDSLVANKPLDKMMVGQVVINGVTYDSCGVQFKGNSSYNAPGNKKPFKIDFNEYLSGQNFDGLKTINLNNCMKDPTLMREKIMLDFCRENQIPAPRSTYAKLYLNGQYWGLYSLVEQMDKTALDRLFNENEGNLFKGDPNGTLQWYGTADSSYQSKYELKTNKTANDFSDLIHLIDVLNNTPSASFYDSLEKVLETESVIKAWAADIIFSNLDSYRGSGHNYYIYHDTIIDKFRWIIWDVNEVFGNFNMGMTVQQLESLSLFYIPNPVNSRPLTNKMNQNSTYKSEYINTVCDMLSNSFTSQKLNAKIDSLYNKIKPDVYADTKKPYTNQNFEDNINMTVMNNIPGLKSFITNRRSSLISQLAANGCFVGEEELAESSRSLQVYPNPNSGKFNLKISGFENLKMEKLKIYNVLGEEVYSKQLTTSNEQLSTNLPSGIYFLKIGDAVSKFSIVD